MRTEGDKLFERWCRGGDARALGELFDRCAPELLKLAIHLVGDASEAEDAVQATFLAAIEHRTTIDATQPAMPWLCGVLAHKARDSKRRAARQLDPERLFARAELDASVPLESRELSGEVAKAIDRVDEPCRRVLVLKLRHGMDIADVAHVLERSPATVRVQLHRGLEKLRQLLPASIASAIALGLAAPRGLAAIKSVVLHEAAASIAVATSTSIIGGMLVGKKLVLAGAAAVALIAVMLWRERSAQPAHAEPEQARPALAQLEPSSSAQLDATSTQVDDANATSTTREVHAEPAAGASVVRGVVTDGETREPIAGAHLRLYAPRATLATALQRERPDLFEARANGELAARGYSDWPMLGPLTPAARFDRDPIVVYDYPGASQEPLAETISASDGSFSLAAPASGGVLACERDGYGRRIRAATDPARRWDVALWRERALSGRVVDDQLHVPSESLHLVVHAVRHRDRAPGPGESPLGEALGVWTADTDAEGRFTVKVAAPDLDFDTTTPGWGSPLSQADPSEEPGLLLIASRIAAFHFFDASSREPIERVHVLGRELTNQYVRWSGVFRAPRGMLDIPGNSISLRGGYAAGTVQFIAWADGYVEATCTLSDIAKAGVIEVPMERGEVPALEGWVRRGGTPVDGAYVALIGLSPLQWRADDDWLVDAVETSVDGHFRVTAPRGSYILRVTVGAEPFMEKFDITETMWETRMVAGREPYFEHVEVPVTAPLAIDLDHTASIEVEVADTDGKPREAHVIALRGDDGRQVRAETDAVGRAKFVCLSPGKFQVMLPYVSTRGSFAADEVLDVDLARGETKSLRAVIPASTGPRHARIVASGVATYTGWRARYDTEQWNDIAGDGTVPMDLSTVAFTLQILAPDKRAWSVDVPKQAPDGFEILLDAGECRLRGVLLDDDTGEPLARRRVHAEPWGADDRAARSTPSCVSDAEGRFELTGLAAAKYSLAFSAWYEEDSPYKGLSFVPDALPSPDPAWLEIRLGGAHGKIRIIGRVVQATNGEPVADAMVWVECIVPSNGGGLRLGTNLNMSHTDAAGHFEIEVPRTALRKVSVYRNGEPKAALVKSFDDLGTAEEPPIELLLP